MKCKDRSVLSQASDYLKGLLHCSKKKATCTGMENHLSERNSQSYNHFISDSTWDWQKVMGCVAVKCYNFFITFLGAPVKDICLAIDEVGFKKSGVHSACVSRQWLSCLGKQDMGQMAVAALLSYKSFFSLISMRLFNYTTKLSKLEVEELKMVINKGKHTSQAFRTAYILLNCDKGEFSADKKIKNTEICRVLKIGERTIDRVKKKFFEEGIEDVMERRPSSQTYTKKVDGDVEAKLITLCCSDPPKGYAKWSLRLLAHKMVELEYIDYISHVTVGEVLKKRT